METTVLTGLADGSILGAGVMGMEKETRMWVFEIRGGALFALDDAKRYEIDWVVSRYGPLKVLWETKKPPGSP